MCYLRNFVRDLSYLFVSLFHQQNLETCDLESHWNLLVLFLFWILAMLTLSRCCRVTGFLSHQSSLAEFPCCSWKQAQHCVRQPHRELANVPVSVSSVSKLPLASGRVMRRLVFLLFHRVVMCVCIFTVGQSRGKTTKQVVNGKLPAEGSNRATKAICQASGKHVQTLQAQSPSECIMWWLRAAYPICFPT